MIIFTPLLLKRVFWQTRKRMAVARDVQVAWGGRSGSFLGNAAAAEENDTHIHILLDIEVQKY
jgi:hypothetical protein